MFLCIFIIDLHKCISAHDPGLCNREDQPLVRGMTASLFTKLDSENAFLMLTPKIFLS